MEKLNGHFYYIPMPGSLEKILKSFRFNGGKLKWLECSLLMMPLFMRMMIKDIFRKKWI